RAADVRPVLLVEQVEHLGIGRADKPGALAEVLDSVLRPGVVTSAREVAGGIRTDGALVAARRVTSLAGG
ncbi:hypothetical protein ACFPQC_00770, partial [Kibdelosporangium philippinense]